MIDCWFDALVSQELDPPFRHDRIELLFTWFAISQNLLIRLVDDVGVIHDVWLDLHSR